MDLSTFTSAVRTRKDYEMSREMDLNKLYRGAVYSSLVYDSKEQIGNSLREMGDEVLSFNIVENEHDFALVVEEEEMVFIVFRGSNEVEDWMSNFQSAFYGTEWGRFHMGFAQQVHNIQGAIREAVNSGTRASKELYVTGHSRGAAMATILTTHLRNEGIPVYGLYTFGSPRVMDRASAHLFDNDLADFTYRVVNYGDPITRLPTRVRGYSHVGMPFVFGEDGTLRKNNRLAWWEFLRKVVVGPQHWRSYFHSAMEKHSMDEYLRLLGDRVQCDGKQ